MNKMKEDRPTPRLLIEEYDRLCKEILPVETEDIWRMSRLFEKEDPDQGWKIHLSATIFSAKTVLEKSARFLQKEKVLFKAVKSLKELGKLNSGIFYGYSQIGKFMTVYPQNEKEFVCLVKKLHNLTKSVPAPVISFDLKFKKKSNVYFRYGAFKTMETENEKGEKIPAIFDQRGILVPDKRNTLDGKPDWIVNPFENNLSESLIPIQNPLFTNYRIFKSLSLRGKGGVYAAIDLSNKPPRICLIKEGCRNGEVNWCGKDGYDLVKREAEALQILKRKGLDLPAIFDFFEYNGNFYLVTEFIEGQNLHHALGQRTRRLSIKKVLEYSYQIALFLEKIHCADWVWQDCKPGNIILTKRKKLRLFDFEGSCRNNEYNPIVWGTEEFLPSGNETDAPNKNPRSIDLFALGALIYFLLFGTYYKKGEEISSLRRKRKGISPKLEKTVLSLLGENPEKRPSAKNVARRLLIQLKNISKK